MVTVYTAISAETMDTSALKESSINDFTKKVRFYEHPLPPPMFTTVHILGYPLPHCEQQTSEFQSKYSPPPLSLILFLTKYKFLLLNEFISLKSAKILTTRFQIFWELKNFYSYKLVAFKTRLVFNFKVYRVLFKP